MQPVIVDSTIAHRWQLRQVPHQHPDMDSAIARYASGMRQGYWFCNGQNPITFNDQGRLVDGRCRVAAVRAAGVPIRLWVTGWHFGTRDILEDDIA